MMGLSLESPINFDGSTAHDKATRRDSTHASSFAPFHALKARRLSRRLTRQQSDHASATKSVACIATFSSPPESVPAQQSLIFKLPHHLREHIYSFLISPTGTRTLHILLKQHLEPDQRANRFRSCRADPAIDIACSSARCRALLDTATGTYRGRFDSVISFQLISKHIGEEFTSFLYSHYEFDFDQPSAVRNFCGSISLHASQHLRSVSFEPQYWVSTYKYKDMMLPEHKWRMTWEAVGQLQGLQRLTVRYTSISRDLPHNLQVLDPRHYIPRRDGLVIDVEAPWIQEVALLEEETSLLFKLPQSLREQIYDYIIESKGSQVMRIVSKRTLHNHVICTSLGFGMRSYYCCPMLPSFRLPGYDANTEAREYIYPCLKGSFDFPGILRVDRNTYNEASPRLYNKFEFVFDHPLALLGLVGRLSPPHRDVITKIKLEFDEQLFRDLFRSSDNISQRFGITFEMWEQCWKVLDQLQGLQELTIRFKTRGIAPSEGSKLDPRTFMEKRNRLKRFTLEAPWITLAEERDDDRDMIRKVVPSTVRMRANAP